MADHAPHDNHDATHLWVDCPGCRYYGKIGIPLNYASDVVGCPKCRQVVRVRVEDRLLWRPSRPAAIRQAATAHVAVVANRVPRMPAASEPISAALDNEHVQLTLMIAAAVVPLVMAILLPKAMYRGHPRAGDQVTAITQTAPMRLTVPRDAGATNPTEVKRETPGAVEPMPTQPGVDELYRRAKERLAKGDYAAAICDFDDVLRAKPEFVWCYYHRAGAYSRMGNQNAALADLHLATVAMPTEAKVWRARAVVYHRMGNLPAAVADIHRAVELANKGAENQRADFAKRLKATADQFVDELCEQATANLKSGHCQAAIAEFSDVLRHRPQFASAWLRRAAAYDAICQYDKALDDLNVDLYLRPGPAQAFKLRSVLHERKNDYVAALADMRMAQRLDPGRAEYRERIRWLAGRQQLQQRSPQVASGRRIR